MRSITLAASLAAVLLTGALAAPALAAQTSTAVMTLEGTAGENALTQAFAAALANPDAAQRHAFVETNAGPAFVQREGIPAIKARFDAEHATLAGATLLSVDVPDGRGAATAVFRLPDGQRRVVEIRFGGSPDAPRMANFGVDLPQ